MIATIRKPKGDNDFLSQIEYTTILITSIAPVSAAWSSLKALQAEKHKSKRENIRQGKATFVIKRSDRVEEVN